MTTIYHSLVKRLSIWYTILLTSVYFFGYGFNFYEIIKTQIHGEFIAWNGSIIEQIYA